MTNDKTQTNGKLPNNQQTGETNKSKEKLTAKKIGLKSTLVFDNKLALISFANDSNSATKKGSNVEFFTNATGDIVYSTNPVLFKTSVNTQDVKITSIKKPINGEKDRSIVMSNPLVGGLRKDYVNIKSALEYKYFGKIHNNDNIHVQIAYNVADIKKILIPYVDQIIYVCYNLNRRQKVKKNSRRADVIGKLYFKNDLKTFKMAMDSKDPDTARRMSVVFDAITELLNNHSVYSSYFGDLFMVPKRGKNGKVDYDSENNINNHNFNIFRSISMVRQACVHDKVAGIVGSPERLLYDSDFTKSQCFDLYDFIDKICEKRLNEINEEFCTTSANNVYVLSKLYPLLELNDIIQSYYKYAIIKENNNLGVNLRLLREVILQLYMQGIRDKEYDTYRSKLYTLMGYVLYSHLKDSDTLAEMVSELRSNISEDNRLNIYAKYAEIIWKDVSALFARIVTLVSTEMAKKDGNNTSLTGVKISIEQIRQCIKSNSRISYFAKLMLLLGNFLSGKEINELICGFINKFDGIADLLYNAKKCGYNITFSQEFKVLEKAREIANDLRLIKNVMRMRKEPTSHNKQLFVDAATLLGIKSQVLSEEDVQDSVLTDQERKEFFDRLKKNPTNHQIRNFIKNNVIKSKWFFYVARYMRPETCALLMKNKAIVDFAIGEINDTAIARYYNATKGLSLTDTNIALARKDLAKMLIEFSIDEVMTSIEKLNKKDYASQATDSVKEKNKALVTLYLTVAYLIVKNMVKTNTVFSIANSCLERDIGLLCEAKDDFLSLTRRFIRRDEPNVNRYTELRAQIKNSSMDKEKKKIEYSKLKPYEKSMHFGLHNYYYISSNLEVAEKLHGLRNVNSEPVSIHKYYRDNVAHLNVVNKFPYYLNDVSKIESYFDAYAYTMQRMVLEDVLKDVQDGYLRDFCRQNLSLLKEHGTYVKNLLWILNVPFAYNVARYKNLSIKNLFYSEISKEKIGTLALTNEQNQETASASNASNDFAPTIDEEELVYGYKVGQKVCMTSITITNRKGLKGVIQGTEYKISVPPAEVESAGKVLEYYLDKTIEVELTSYNKGAQAFSSQLIVD